MTTFASRPLVPAALHHVRTVRCTRRSFSRIPSWRTSTPGPSEPRRSAVDDAESESKPGSPNTEATPEGAQPDTLEREGSRPPEKSAPTRRGVRVHGSALRRSLRNDEWVQEVSTVEVPTWFGKRNIILREDNDLLRRSDSRVGVLSIAHKLRDDSDHRSLKLTHVRNSMLKKDDQPEGETSGLYPDIFAVVESSEDHGDGAGETEPPVALLEELELRTAMEGSFAVARTENATYHESVRGHVIVQFPHSGGDRFLDRAVLDAASVLHADVIRLDAQDISQMATSFLDANDTRSLAAAQNLGYDTYSAARPIEEGEDHDEIDEEGESDEFVDPRTGRDDGARQPRSARRPGSAFGSIVPAFATISAASIADLGKKLQSGLFAGQGPKAIGISKQLDANPRSAELRLSAFIEAMLDGASEKRSRTKSSDKIGNTFFSSETIPLNAGESAKVVPRRWVHRNGHSVALQLALANDRQGLKPLQETNGGHRTVVLVRDIKELVMTELGEQFVTKLVDVVERRRQAGHQVLIVGTSCLKGPFPGDMKAMVRSLEYPSDDIRLSLFRQLLLTPHHESSGTQWKNEEGVFGVQPGDDVVDPLPKLQQLPARPLPELSKDIAQDEAKAVKENYESKLSEKSEVGTAIRAKGSFWEQSEGDRILELNLRHLHQSLEHLAVDSEMLDRMRQEAAETPPRKLSGVDLLRNHVLHADEVQKVVLTVLALYSPKYRQANKMQINHILTAMALLKESEVEKSAWMAHFSKVQNSKPAEQVRSQSGDNTQSTGPNLEQIKKGANRYEKKLLAGVVETGRIHTTFNDVHAPSETKDALRYITALQLARPDAFKYGVLAHNQLSGLLLYGPPGTGKTLIAKAVAKESGATVLEVSGSSVNEMYVGESEKNVRAIFSLARKLSPCIVFIDEADAIFASRSGDRQRVSHRDIINQFLREWDGMDGANVFVMVATNRPFDMDDAVLRRLPRKLLMDLPTEKDREEILRIHLKGEALDDTVSIPELAATTPFYSGSDLKNLCVAAALTCIKEEMEGWLKTSAQGPLPTKRVLRKEHFDRATAEISASVSEDMSSVRAIRKFDEQYGDRRGRRKKLAWGFMAQEDAPTEGDVRIRRGT